MTSNMELVREGLGTAFNPNSPVWFTLLNGRVEDIYYPDLSTPQGRLELVLVDNKGQRLYESDHLIRIIERPDPDVPIFRQVNSDPMGSFRLSKLAFTDPKRACFLLHVRLEALQGVPTDYQMEVHWDAAPEQSPPTIVQQPHGEGDWMVNNQKNGVAILATSSAFIHDENHKVSTTSSTSRIQIPEDGGFRLVMGFGATEEEAAQHVQETLRQSWTDILSQYRTEWQQYCKRLNDIDGWASPLYYSSIMLLKSLEDKAHPGAIAPSLSRPIQYTAESSYRMATAFWSAGDHKSAKVILRFLLKKQGTDGGFPRTFSLDPSLSPTPSCPHQTAYALLLIWQLEAIRSFQSTVVPAVSFLIHHGGPHAPQKSSFPLHLAALRCAIDLGKTAGEVEMIRQWSSTLTSWEEQCSLPKEGEMAWMSWARLGILPATHPSLLKAAQAFDQNHRQPTPYGPFWATDTESEGKLPHLSVRLTGERGHYELLCDRDPSLYLTALEQVGGNEETLSTFITPKGEKMGETPDPLTHAEYIRLLVSQSWGKPCDLPLPPSGDEENTEFPL
ncbi:hypothetical protein [Marininema halotolerans]|uniref:Glucoamylase (Glucan-1,4-alpha-glucosidase), GH15 family n=1 Tax=Marininema halotolerans TaxID=1155944 RepID=A0A1I6P7S6_9BACL|nr:hypothetical protein [Marininema halotolerans]SFS36241.1 Glucoamylase (glucan-1,4-alpha-glucosidase), GH15 family [Marininema halotolerans]